MPSTTLGFPDQVVVPIHIIEVSASPIPYQLFPEPNDVGGILRESVFYVGDWNYIHLYLDAIGTQEAVNITVSWWTHPDKDSGATITEDYTIPAWAVQGQARMNIPVRGPYVHIVMRRIGANPLSTLFIVWGLTLSKKTGQLPRTEGADIRLANDAFSFTGVGSRTVTSPILWYGPMTLWYKAGGTLTNFTSLTVEQLRTSGGWDTIYRQITPGDISTEGAKEVPLSAVGLALRVRIEMTVFSSPLSSTAWSYMLTANPHTGG